MRIWAWPWKVSRIQMSKEDEMFISYIQSVKGDNQPTDIYECYWMYGPFAEDHKCTNRQILILLLWFVSPFCFLSSFSVTSTSWMWNIVRVSLPFLLSLFFSFLFHCPFILSSGRFPQLYLSNKVFISTLTFLFLKDVVVF